MATRATYKFSDQYKSVFVYKHFDGMPACALQFIENAKRLAWPLPRFEADEFAAAFIAANKTGSGDIRVTGSHEQHADADYRYEVQLSHDGADLHVAVYAINWDGAGKFERTKRRIE